MKQFAFMAAFLAVAGCATVEEVDAPAAAAAPPECVILLHGLLRTERSLREMETSLEEAGYRVVRSTCHQHPDCNTPLPIRVNRLLKQRRLILPIRWGERALIKVFHYDNNADPEATSGDDYAWQTKFTHIGAQFALPLGVGLLSQWIDGSTIMGPDLGPWHVQDVMFDSTYAMLTRSFGEHRVSLRYEWFDLQPYNDPPGITNQDKGNAVAVAWLYQITPKFRLGAEYLQIASDHCKQDNCSWTLDYGLPQKTRDSQVQLSVRWYFAGKVL